VITTQFAVFIEKADKFNGLARHSAAERAWSGISRFDDNCRKKIKNKKLDGDIVQFFIL